MKESGHDLGFDLDPRKQAEIDAAWALHLGGASQPIGVERREWLLRHIEWQGGRCAYCGIAMIRDAPPSSDRRVTLDHVIALSCGGSDTEENTVAACYYCNITKGSMSKDEYLASPALAKRRAAAGR